LAILSMDY